LYPEIYCSDAGNELKTQVGINPKLMVYNYSFITPAGLSVPLESLEFI
jgi:hypothetical protein